MEKKEITWTVKILGIVGGILSGVSLIIPWGGFDFLGSGLSIYPWGTSAYTTALTEWDFFNIEIFTSTPTTTEGILFGIFMILTFIFALIAFIIGILGFRHVNVKYSNSFITAGIMGVIAMIMFIIGISQITSGNLGTSSIDYGIGFFLIIIGFILYFIAYGIQQALIPVPKTAPYQQPIYHQPGYQPPVVQQHIYQQPAYQQQPTHQAPPQQHAQQPPEQQLQQPQFCDECGTKMLPGAKFCSKCGKTF